MKNIFLPLLLLLGYISLSQNKMEYSEVFKEPEGWTKLIQLKNSNTALIEITKREGVFITLYGSDRKTTGKKKLGLTKVGVKLGGPSSVPAIFEINGDVTMFILFWADGKEGLIPTVFRIIVDGKTGDLTEETEIFNMGTLTRELNQKIADKEIGWPDAYVEKDPDGDSYALISNNTLSEKQEPIKVFHFAPNHSLISSYDIKLPSGFNQSGFLGAYVKNDYVIVGHTDRNYIKDGKGTGKFVLSKFSKDNPSGIHKELQYKEYNQDGGFPNAAFIYNPVNKNITMILVNYLKKESNSSYYDIIYQAFNPANMELSLYKKADLNKVNNYYQNKLKSETNFNGIIQGASVLKNGNLALVYQKCYSMTNNVNVTQTNFGDIGIEVISPEGKSIDGWAMYYSATVYGSPNSSFNFNFAENGRKGPFGMEDPTAGKSWYSGVDFVATENANYLFLNNSMQNFEKNDDQKNRAVKSMMFGNAIQYTFKPGGGGKEYLFGPPEGEKKGKYGNFTAAHYDPSTKTYCTLMGDFKGREQKVVWFKLD